jgi:hypothetical protein
MVVMPVVDLVADGVVELMEVEDMGMGVILATLNTHNMSAFDIGAKNNKKFFYKIGSVTTQKAWSKPNNEKLEKFLFDLRKKQYFPKYQLFLVGGVVNGGIGKTNDIDLVLNGHMNYHLEKVFHDMYNLALNKHRLLIDVKWLDKKPSDNLEKKSYQAVQFGVAMKQVGDVVSAINLFEGNIRLTEHLVLRTIKFPHHKNTETNIKYLEL